MTTLYLETYATRISDTYVSLRHKAIALAHFWRFVHDSYPEVKTCAAVLPAHARAYIPHALERARQAQRGGPKTTFGSRPTLGSCTSEHSLPTSVPGRQSQTLPSGDLRRALSHYSGTTCAASDSKKLEGN